MIEHDLEFTSVFLYVISARGITDNHASGMDGRTRTEVYATDGLAIKLTGGLDGNAETIAPYVRSNLLFGDGYAVVAEVAFALLERNHCVRMETFDVDIHCTFIIAGVTHPCYTDWRDTEPDGKPSGTVAI